MPQTAQRLAWTNLNTGAFCVGVSDGVVLRARDLALMTAIRSCITLDNAHLIWPKVADEVLAAGSSPSVSFRDRMIATCLCFTPDGMKTHHLVPDMAVYLAPLPAPLLGPGVSELFPVLSLSDLVLPPVPASFSFPGCTFSGAVLMPGVP